MEALVAWTTAGRAAQRDPTEAPSVSGCACSQQAHPQQGCLMYQMPLKELVLRSLISDLYYGAAVTFLMR